MRWEPGPGGDGGSWRGFDGAGLLAAIVVRYRDDAGEWWAVTVQGELLDGRHESAEDAMRAVASI